jgi:hypothetical protein
MQQQDFTMTVFIDRHGHQEVLADYLARLEPLLADLQNLQRGIFPAADQLESAPLIDHFFLSARADPCLVGKVHGHPYLRSPQSITSSLWAYAPELGWARTLSRFYRLGRPAGSESHS